MHEHSSRPNAHAHTYYESRPPARSAAGFELSFRDLALAVAGFQCWLLQSVTVGSNCNVCRYCNVTVGSTRYSITTNVTVSTGGSSVSETLTWPGLLYSATQYALGGGRCTRWPYAGPGPTAPLWPSPQPAPRPSPVDPSPSPPHGTPPAQPPFTAVRSMHRAAH